MQWVLSDSWNHGYLWVGGSRVHILIFSRNYVHHDLGADNFCTVPAELILNSSDIRSVIFGPPGIDSMVGSNSHTVLTYYNI